MGLILESTKVFNELRNASDFATNPGDFTTTIKANVGERLKIVTKFRVFWDMFVTPATTDTFVVAVVTGGHSIISTQGQDFQNAGFRVGDVFDFIDNLTGPTTFSGQTITLISGAYMEFTNTGTIPSAPTTFTDARIVATNELTTLRYDFNLIASSDSGNLINDVFNLIMSYEFSALTIAGGDVTGVYKSSLFSQSGSAIARHTANVNTYEQVFEVETILTVPYYKEGQLINLEQALKPEPFNIETQFYTEGITLGVGSDSATNRDFDLSRLANDSVGYFNENFDGGERQYSIVSVAYEELTSGNEREVPEITETTKVTVVMASNNVTMAATDPAVVSFSYTPTQNQYRGGTANFNDTWNFDTLRALMDGGVVAGTNIIKELGIVVDNPNQITFTFNITLSQSQRDIMFVNNGRILLNIDNEDPALTSENSNRLNLIIDITPFTKNTDEDGLLVITKDEVYYHNSNFIEDGTTDLQAWNESYIQRKIRFKLVTSDVLVEVNRMWAQVIGFNPTTEDYFVIQKVEIPSVTQTVTINSGKLIQQLNTNTTRGFLIPVTSEFNKLVISTDTFADPDQFYDVEIGIMINWETWEALLVADQVFFNDSEPNNGQNKKTSNYSDKNGFEVRLSLLHEIKKNDIITKYHNIQAVGNVFDYDLDKNVTPKFATAHVYKDVNDVVLPLKLVIGEDNEVTVTNDDGTAKITPDDFNGQIRLEVFEQGNEKSIHIISSIDGVIAGDILKPLAGETLMNKSIVAGNYTSKCLVAGGLLGERKYSISSEIQELIVFLNNFSMEFDGFNESVNHGNAANLNFDKDDPFTLSIWFKLNTGSKNQRLADKSNSSARGYSFFIRSTNRVSFALTSVVTPENQIAINGSTTLVIDGSWHNFTVTYDGSQTAAGTKLYLDGILETPTVLQDNLTTTTQSTGNFHFGVRGVDNSLPLDGLLNSGAVWNKALDAAAVMEVSSTPLINLATQADSANLVLYNKMGDGADFDDTIPGKWFFPDESGNGNDGESVNMEEVDRKVDSP